jgi:hypothetical protein
VTRPTAVAMTPKMIVQISSPVIAMDCDSAANPF